MKTQRAYIPFLVIVLALVLVFLTACNTHQIQTTSGNAYLSRYPQEQTALGVGPHQVDEEVRQIAAVEPHLQFPARIGLVKLYQGQMSNLHELEVAAWEAARKDLGAQFGEFVPVSRLIAESVYTAPEGKQRIDTPAELVRKVRLGAARQHLDLVLIYEVFSESKSTQLASAVADWTIIGGYFVPSHDMRTTGFANALLLDVRTGYPYATASASLTEEKRSSTWGRQDRLKDLADQNEVATALELIPEVKTMMVELMESIRPERLARAGH